MLQLTGQAIIPFICLVVNAIMVAFVLYSKRVRLKKLFLVFLLAGAGTNVAGLLVHLQLSYEVLTLWKVALPVFSSWSIIAYMHFIAAYAGRPTGKVIRYGYTWLSFNTIAAVVIGLLQATSVFGTSGAVIASGGVLLGLVAINDIALVMMTMFMVKVLKKAREPEERNRSTYLLAGLGIMIAAGLLKYAFNEHFLLPGVGIIGNGIIITYTFMRYRLLNFQVLMRRWVVYSAMTVCMTLVYVAMLLGTGSLLRLLPSQFGIPSMVVMVLLFGLLFNWVKNLIDRATDRLFYGNRYVHRQMLLTFAGKLNTLLNIKEIADALLVPLAKTVNAKHVALILPFGEFYTSKYVARLDRDEPVMRITFSRKNPIIKWLEDNGAPLFHGGTEYIKLIEQLTERDRGFIEEANVKVLMPIISKEQLVGILALGAKEETKTYSRDEIDLVSKLADESAVAIENAQIYQSARDKAEKDGLTSLYNHRAFQEILNQQIEDSTGSGEDFSLLFIDLDFFKTYNDIYGHVLGDDILKEVGSIITKSIRTSDIGGRYGGDEFAVILRETNGEQAFTVAERIRINLEASMNERGIMLTCSIGVACWRIDGIMRGTIIQAADDALDAAKQAGRNRVCLAGETTASETRPASPLSSMDTQAAVESIVFALASTVDARDHYTFGHSKAVSRYSTELAQEIGYNKEDIRRIRSAALLHDIGKLNMPDTILNKIEPLTETEWEMIKTHPAMGQNILKYVVGLRDCVEAVLYHHERWDGNGYPRGLKGKDIPLDARIIAVADSFDAMTSGRAYKKGRMTESVAIDEILRGAGTQFDPELAATFARIHKKSIIRSHAESS